MGVKDRVKRALKRYEQDWCIPPEFAGINYDKLADQAIVIECEVEHKDGDTSVFIDESEDNVWLEGLHGTPGKAIAIIIPLEEE